RRAGILGHPPQPRTSHRRLSSRTVRGVNFGMRLDPELCRPLLRNYSCPQCSKRDVDLEDGTVADARRLDTDDRFTVVADASAFAPAVEELAALARRPRWIAEDPELHLAPHLRGAVVEGLRIGEIRAVQEGVLAVSAECDQGASRRELRRLAWALLGTIA